MTMHLFGTVLTPQAVAHNNRGESEGTISTLQKVIRNGDLHSTVSSEAIRYALRECWLADAELKLNRKVSHNASDWTDKEFKKPGSQHNPMAGNHLRPFCLSRIQPCGGNE